MAPSEGDATPADGAAAEPGTPRPGNPAPGTPAPRPEPTPASDAAGPEAVPVTPEPFDRADATTALPAVAPAQDGPDTAVIGWVSPPPRRRRVAGWALALAIIALVASLFGAWGLPVGIAAGIVALRAVRGRLARTVAVWALALAVLSVLYGTGWLIWMLGQR